MTGDYWIGGSPNSVSIPRYAMAEGAVMPLEKPVYVVSGFMRSGTSMMMLALKSGGMDAVWDERREEFRRKFADDDYDPNRGGLYELHRTEYQKPGFPQGYEGKLIKALRSGPGRMAVMPGGIRVVWMLRDHEERRQSYNAFFNPRGDKPGMSAAQIAADEERNLALAKNRRDTRVFEVPYRAVVEDPETWLTRIAQFFNVKLDVAKAAAVVDPEQYRFRLEELEVGIV